jgi:DNA-binding beta-propeller fold protein YncE
MTDTAIANIDGGGAVEYSAVDGHGRLFVNGEEKNEIIAIDTAANKVVAHYPMPTCERPHGLAIDSDSERLFSTCANDVMVVVDGKSGANIASLPIGNRSDAAAFDPKRKLAFSSNGEGTITIVREKDAQSFEVAGTVKTAAGARTMAIDPETGRLFLVTADVSGGAPSNTSTAKSRINFVPGTVKLLIFDPQD